MEDRFPLFILILHNHPVHFTVGGVREDGQTLAILRRPSIFAGRIRRIAWSG
jgi:hypothetical protein